MFELQVIFRSVILSKSSIRQYRRLGSLLDEQNRSSPITILKITSMKRVKNCLELFILTFGLFGFLNDYRCTDKNCSIFAIFIILSKNQKKKIQKLSTNITAYIWHQLIVVIFKLKKIYFSH